MWSLAEERGMLRHEGAFEKFADINEVFCLAPKWHGVVNSLLLFFFCLFLFCVLQSLALAFVALVLQGIDCILLALDYTSSSFCSFFFSVPLCLALCLHFAVAVRLCSANPIMKQ